MTSGTQGRFEGKFLSKLSKIDRQDIEGFLGQLVREKNFLEVVFNALLDGILVLRANLEVMYCNNTALELLGLTNRRKVVGERITALTDSGEFRDLVARFALKRGARATAEFELGGAAPRSVRATIIPLEADRGSASGSVIVLLHDISEARRLEEQKRKAERAMTFTTLAAGLAHEIKNPLNSLQIHAQLLQRALKEMGLARRKVDMARVEQSTDIVLEEIQRLGRVVEQFLAAVRPTRPMTQRGSINTTVEKVVAMMRAEAGCAGVRLDVILDHDIPAFDFDPTQVAMALLNLVKNSIEALEGRAEPRVEIRTAMAENGCNLRVADNGHGMTEETRGRILEPYFTTKVSGTGLGLPIVSRVVEEHGGRMDVFTEPDKGTAVTLFFPLNEKPVRLLGTPFAESAG